MTTKLENLQDGYDHHRLTLEELQLLLSTADIVVNPDSPLRDLMPVQKTKANTGLIEELRQKGVLSQDKAPKLMGPVRQALEIAARPQWVISLRMGDWRGISTATLLSRDGLHDHSLVSITQHEDQSVSLAYFLSKEHILSLLEPHVRFNALYGGPDLQFSLTLNEYMILLATADAFRQGHLEALLERQVVDDWKVAIEEIESALDKGAAFFDPRWLVSVGHFSIPMPYQWQRENVRSGIEGLVAKGLLEPVGEGQYPRYGLNRKLEIFCTAVIGITGFAALQIDRMTPDHGRGIVCLSLLRTPETIWLSGYNHLAGPSPTVTLFSAEGFFVAQALIELMERSADTPTPTRAEIHPGPAKRLCNQCGTRLRASVKFCTNCGSPTQ